MKKIVFFALLITTSAFGQQDGKLSNLPLGTRFSFARSFKFACNERYSLCSHWPGEYSTFSMTLQNGVVLGRDDALNENVPYCEVFNNWREKLIVRGGTRYPLRKVEKDWGGSILYFTSNTGSNGETDLGIVCYPNMHFGNQSPMTIREFRQAVGNFVEIGANR